MAPIERHSIRWLAHTLGVTLELLLSLSADVDRHYRPFLKRKGEKVRVIDNPDPILKHVQVLIRQRLLAHIPLSDIVHGCRRRRSPLTNASQHVHQQNVASIDVKNFYPSVTNRIVYRIFRDRVLLGPDLARVLTRLTTRHGHLPHGAPTSDALGNLALVDVDLELEQIARDLELTVSRYVDNIDFNGKRSREAIAPTIRALQAAGFAVRHNKTYNAGPREPHIVTGYTVNGTHPSVRLRDRDRVRSAGHQLICAHRDGRSIIDLEKSVRGRLEHVRRTNPGFVLRLESQIRSAGIPWKVTARK
jgi:RNA-directed DNA polymerase